MAEQQSNTQQQTAESAPPQDGNVLAFKRPPSRRPLDFTEKHPSAACRHKSAYIDVRKRQLSCQECGALMDAMDFIIELAHKVRQVDYRIAEWRDSWEKLHAADFDRKARQEARKIKNRPENPGEAQAVWDDCAAYLEAGGRKPFAIFKSRSAADGWACETLLEDGTLRSTGWLSVGYIRNAMNQEQWAKAQEKSKRKLLDEPTPLAAPDAGGEG